MDPVLWNSGWRGADLARNQLPVLKRSGLLHKQSPLRQRSKGGRYRARQSHKQQTAGLDQMGSIVEEAIRCAVNPQIARRGLQHSGRANC